MGSFGAMDGWGVLAYLVARSIYLVLALAGLVLGCYFAHWRLFGREKQGVKFSESAKFTVITYAIGLSAGITVAIYPVLAIPLTLFSVAYVRIIDPSAEIKMRLTNRSPLLHAIEISAWPLIFMTALFMAVSILIRILR